MKLCISIILVFIIMPATSAQEYTSSSVFAHNDYAQENPFYGAYHLRVGYIEADIFLKDGELMVAHHRNEIQKERTLEALYLIPLKNEIIKNKGWAYPDTTLRVSLMIDLKTEGVPALQKLIEKLKSYPELVAAKGLEVVISGNVPSPDRWEEFPTFIHFDGRPGISYSVNQLERISLISTNFRNHSHWDGKSTIPESDRIKLEKLIQSVQGLNKKIRFWATPDFENAWMTLMKMKVDVIGTDNVPVLVNLLDH